MHKIIVAILKQEFGNAIKKTVGSTIYNIFPMHIPDGAIDNSFSKAIIYNILSNEINRTSNFYTIQLTTVSKDYETARDMANQIRDIFNDTDWANGIYSVPVTGLLSTSVTNILDGGYDTDTGVYFCYVSILAKGTI